MKLRNLLIALTTVATFMACSNNDDPVAPVIPEGEGIATLSVKIAELQTKSLGGEGDVTNATVKDLCVLIFKGTDGNAKLEKIGRSAKAGDTKVEDIPVTAGNKKIIVLANVSEALKGFDLVEGDAGTPYSTVLEKPLTFSESEQNGTLSMNSKTYDATLSVSKKNYLGYSDKTNTDDEALVTVSSGASATEPVKLYRNVAQVTLEGITLDKNPLYPDAELTLRDVFILHGHEQSMLIGENGLEWGSTCVTDRYLNGFENVVYEKWVETFGSGKLKAFNYIEDKTKYNPYLGKANTYRDSYTGDEATLDLSTNSWKTDYSRSFYVYENENTKSDDIHTLLVVKADYSYTDKDTKKTMPDRYYTIAVGITGVTEGGYALDNSMKGLTRDGKDKFLGVLRNLSYEVSLTIAGPGSETPFDREYSANISASVKVNEWNVVKVPAEVN